MRSRYCNAEELNALGKASSAAKVQKQSPEQPRGGDWTGHSKKLELVV